MRIILFVMFFFIFSFTQYRLIADAQDDRRTINVSQIPQEGSAVKDFVPRGWIIEEQLAKDDLNGDTLPDVVLKLIEKPGAKKQEDTAEDRYRALVILLKTADGKLRRAGVATHLLQCTTCGGAFYGVVEAPANISVKKGVIIVKQDHGSRNVTETTYRFRYDQSLGKFVLIGLDIVDNDRATGEVVDESINYLTGVKITKISRYNEKTEKYVPVSSKNTRVEITKKVLDDIDYEKIEFKE
ncbi:MAG: hypothetical protein AB1489_35280 [Acidobacteriota bacterium]